MYVFCCLISTVLILLAAISPSSLLLLLRTVDCAEALYLLLLSDGDLVGTRGLFPPAAGSQASELLLLEKCGFFHSPDQIDEASAVILSTTWDQADRLNCMEVKARLQQLWGFEVESVATKESLEKERAKSRTHSSAGAKRSGGAAGATGGSTSTIVADAHDSYEALVREAGMVEMKWLVVMYRAALSVLKYISGFIMYTNAEFCPRIVL
jgi:hypothetical protein